MADEETFQRWIMKPSHKQLGFFFSVPNNCNTIILTDIHGHTQFFVVDDEITYKYYINTSTR